MFRSFLIGFLIGFLILIGIPVSSVWAEEAELFRTPGSTFGPSGLLFTQSTDTLLPGEIEVGVGGAYEHSSTDPDYLINEMAVTVTFGISERVEVSARVPYVYNFESHGVDSAGISGGEFSLKGRLLDQGDFRLPAVGFSLTYFTPLGSNIHEFDAVESWGLKGLFLTSAQVDLSPSIFDHYYAGLYADGGMFIRDLDKPTEERHVLIDFGISLPLVESRRLQLILETNATIGNELPLQGNYTALTAALRYVAPSFSLAGGVQHRLKRDEGIQDTDRFVLQAGYLF